MRQEGRLESQGNKQKEDDDCYEYKLVGVNVHKGMANQGRYWSYININREDEDFVFDCLNRCMTPTCPRLRRPYLIKGGFTSMKARSPKKPV